MMRLFVSMQRDPVKALSRLPLARRGGWAWGKSMGFQQWSAGDRVFRVMSGCAFHSFFVDHGEPQLTQLFCNCDAGWMSASNMSARPIRIDRPTTISTGGKTCSSSSLATTKPRV